MVAGRSTGFVGRQRELLKLGAYLEQARNGTGHAVIVSGEGGIGKTRLCEELATAARDAGVGVAWTACWEAGGFPPFWPWRQLFDQVGGGFGQTWMDEGEPELARARLFAAAADGVRRAGRERAWLFVVDDLHWADAGSVQLVAHVAALVRSAKVLLVAASRDDRRASRSLVHDLRRHVEWVPLEGFGADEVGELVGDLTGSPPGPGVARSLFEMTAGNPLFATELVRRFHGRGGLDLLAKGVDVPVPPTVRAVLDERFADLSELCRQILSIAAIVGAEFELGLVAEVAGRAQLEVLDALDEAVATGVVAALDPSRYRFSHPLVRSVLDDDVGISRRVRLHARIGDALESRVAHGDEVDPATLSFHYMNAVPAGYSAKAVSYAELAARAAMTAVAYDDAVAFYDRALAASAPDSEPGRRVLLLLGSAEAKAACGDHKGARTAFLAAADRARRDGHGAQLARAALGLAGSGFEVALFDDDQIALLEEALATLADVDVALRSRLAARLSVALSLTGNEQRRTELADTAVRLATEVSDTGALAHALAARSDAHAGPADVARRAVDAVEIIRLGQARGDLGTELLGRRLRLLAALEAGDVTTFDDEAHAFGVAADRLGQPAYQWYVKLWRATRAAMRGRLAEQESLIQEAEELGRAAGSVNCDILVLAHRWFAWLEAGNVDAVLTYFEARLPAGSYAELGPQMLPVVAGRPLLAGRPDEARAVIDAAAGDLKAIPPDAEWLTLLAQVADLCFRLGGHRLVPWLYDTLAPFADLWSVDGIGAYAHGPVHRQLGLLACLLGRRVDASAHFDAALAGNLRAGADLLVARTLLDRGVALEEPATLRSAQAHYRRLGVDRRVGEIDRLLVAPHDDDERVVGTNEFRRDGDDWMIVFAGRRSRVRDSKGIRDIARLLAEPRREIPALDLAAEGVGTARQGADLGPLIDSKARETYKARLVELEAELDAADAAADPERSARVHAERDALLAQLSAAYGLAGRPRRSGDPAERARTAVTARIRDAVRRVEGVHPELGRHLARSIRTGTLCAYDPDPPASWEL